MKIPDIIPITDLRQDAAAVLKRLKDVTGPVVVTQRGRAVAVMQSIETYERVERERDILRRLVAGERDIEDGQGHDLADVMAEADALLREKSEA